MKNWWKSLTARDRWEILRIVGHYRADNMDNEKKAAMKTTLTMRNRYSGRTSSTTIAGHWDWEDFPDGTYR